MINNLRIRKIKKKDNELARRFCLSIYQEMGWDKRFAYGLENLKRTFGGSGEIFLIAKESLPAGRQGEKIVGCAGLRKLTKEEALMKRFYVAKKFRGRGLADLLFKRIKNFSKKNKYQTIFLDVYRNNIRAQKFYQKKRFKIFNPRPNKKWPESQNPELFEFRKLNLKN